MATATTPLQESRIAAPSRQHVALVIVASLVVAAYAPLLAAHFHQLWLRPHYQFFPLVMIGAIVLGARAIRQAGSLPAGSASVSWGLAAFAWLLLAGAEVLHSSWLAAVGFQVVVLAAIHGAGGAALVKKMLPAWAFLWLLIPPPFGLDNTLVVSLQRLTSYWSSAVLDEFGIVHIFAGNVVEIAGKRLFVEEACAGVNSLFSILACTLFYVLFTHVPIVRACFLILAAVWWVLLANIARVVLIAYLLQSRGADLTEGWRHEALGYALFAVALVLIWSSDRLLLFLASSRARAAEPEPSRDTASPVGPACRDVLCGLDQSWLGSWSAGAAFGLLLAVYLLVYGVPALASASPDALDVAPARLEADALPEQIDGWRRENFARTTRNPGSAFGEFSSTWTYHADSQAVAFSLDYPYPAWHEAQECYQNQGWEVEELIEHSSPSAALPEFYREVRLKKAGMKSGLLFYCEFDHTGRAAEPERRGVSAALDRYETVLRGWTTWPVHPPTRQVGTLFQFQLFLESQSPLPPEDVAASEHRFFKAYCLTHERLFPASTR
jgi:exosortase